MIDEDKTKEQRTGEMVQLNRQIVGLKTAKTKRKQVREALLDSEQQFRALIENAQDAIVIVNPDITIRYESPSMERMTGREAKDRIGKNPFDFCHPDDITKVAEAFIQSLENKIAIVHTELRLQHKNGRWLNFEVIGTNLIDDPAVGGIVLNLREITERKRVEERLQESEERFRALTESTSDWIWEVDLDSVYTYASPKVKDLLGYKPKEILGKTPFDLMPAAEAKRVEEAFRASVESRRPFVELENINMHKDGRLVVLETSGVPIFSDDGRLCGYRGIDRDITERKRVEDALQESEERYRMLVETMNDGMAIQDLDGVMTFVNDKLCQMLGYASDELIGHTAMELIDEVNREKYMEQIRKRRKGVLDPYEIALTRKDGSRLMTRISPQLITDQEGNMVGSFGVATDITDLKRAEEVLRQSEEKLRKLFDSIEYAIVISDLEGKIIDENEAALRYQGYSCKEEVIGKNGFQFISEKDRARVIQEAMQSIERGYGSVEAKFVDKDGKEYDAEATATLMRDASGNAVGFITITRDVTERKQAEEDLQESEERYRLLLGSITDGIQLQDRELRYILVNDELARMAQMPKEKLLGSKMTDIFPGVEETLFYKTYNKVIETGEPAIASDEFVFEDGRRKWYEVHTYPAPEGILTIVTDITERKRAEEELIRLSNAVRMSTDSIVISDLEAKIVEVNEATLRMYGTDDKGDLIGKNSYDLIAPEDREKAIASAKEVLERGYVENQEYHIIIKDGSTVLAAMSTAIMKDMDGKPTGFVAVSRDITERKRMEQSLRDSEEKIRNLFESVADGIVVIDLNGVYTGVNEKLLEMMGFSSKDEILGKNAFEFVAPRDIDRAIVEMQRALEQGSVARLEYTVVRTDGSEYPAEVSATVLKGDSGNPSGFIASIRDITERKRAEKVLRESEERLSSFMESATDSFTLWDSELNLVEINEVGLDSFPPGTKKEDVIGKNLRDISPGVEERGRLEQYLEVIKTGKPFLVEDVVTSPTFGSKHMDVRVFKVSDGLGIIARDITDRKKAEKALRESEEFSSSLLDNAPNPIVVINPDTSLRYVNPALEKLTGFSNTELVNRKTPYPWWTEEKYEKTIKDFEEAMSKGAEGLEELFQRKNGERFWVEINSMPIRRNGELDHYLSNWVDITERKKAEEELRHYSERLRVMAMQLSAAEDNERRRLAQELHDRVGQNLTALSINLSMVRTQLPEEAVAPVSPTLDDSQSIVEQTAAIIRDVMSNLQPPVLEEYGLMAALRWYADRFASRTGISVTVQGEDPSPRLNTSAENSLLRIAQETLTNVAKHSQATQVTVTLVAETKTVRLVVTDDGIGFNTEDVIISDVQKGWGLTTMSERAKSLGGSFDIESRPGHGTRVVVEIGR